MKISGFTIAKNAAKLNYPIVESIKSILPIVDEFVIAMGDNDADDSTIALIEAIGDPKIKIIDSPWNTKDFPKDTEIARQTDIAKNHCTGDWLFYLQTDEVVHENDLKTIKQLCAENIDKPEVEGILFNYIHFWADYKHHRADHGWYKKEIRIVRNRTDIHSWRDAQSFRSIPEFDGTDFNIKEGTRKLNVIQSNAQIFHYGWVLSPKAHLYKVHTRRSNWDGQKVEDKEFSIEDYKKVYGSLSKVAKFEKQHPAVMNERIALFDWKNQLDYNNEFPVKQKFKRRFVTFLEQKIFRKPLFEFKNYMLLK